MPLVTKVCQSAVDGRKKHAATLHAYSRGRNQTTTGQKKDQAAADGQKKWATAPHTFSCGGGGWKSPLATKVCQSTADGKHKRKCRCAKVVPGHGEGRALPLHPRDHVHCGRPEDGPPCAPHELEWGEALLFAIG